MKPEAKPKRKIQKPSRKGILDLADLLIKHTKMYDQDVYGEENSCGTACCLSGLCLADKIGFAKFNKRVKTLEVYAIDCEEAGQEKLGITGTGIFCSADGWPKDLADAYYKIEDDEELTPRQKAKAKVIVALKALSRLKKNGTIGLKVVTRIPQLAKLK